MNTHRLGAYQNLVFVCMVAVLDSRRAAACEVGNGDHDRDCNDVRTEQCAETNLGDAHGADGVDNNLGAGGGQAQESTTGGQRDPPLLAELPKRAGELLGAPIGI